MDHGNFNYPPYMKQNKNLGPYSKNYRNNIFQQQVASPINPRNRPYFSDPLILTRVSQYLQNNERRAVDFDHMANELQRQFHEYKRKKRQAFKHNLQKAYEVISVENSLVDDTIDPDTIDEDEEDRSNQNIRGRKEPAYAFEGDGDMNSTLEDSYMQNAKRSRKTTESNDQELISIVTSDEDCDKEDSVAKADEGKSNEPPPQRKAFPEQASSSTLAVKPTKKRKAEQSLPGSKRFKSSLEPTRPTTSFKDIGGCEKVLEEVTQLLVHMRHPEVYRVLGVSPPRGFLLHGPPGSGKTLLAHAISGELKVPLLKVAAPELVGGLSGQSEERIRELFEQAVALAPCILFIDEVDAITPNRETAHREMERRIVAQLLSSMDELGKNENGDQVLVIGATNRPDALDPALRRAGRFDREVCLGIPDRESRTSILRTLCLSLRLAPGLLLEDVAVMTPGYVGADLKSLVTEAAMAAVNRLFKSLTELKSDSKPADETEATSVESKDKAEESSSEPMEVVESQSCSGDGDVVIVLDKGCGANSEKEYSKEADQSEKDENEIVEIEELPVESTNSDVEVVADPQEQPEDKVPTVADPSKQPETTNAVPSLLHSPPLTEEQLREVFITIDDFQTALKVVQPSAKREGFATVPDVKWEDIGSLQDIRHELEMAILAPVKYPKEFATMGLETAAGVMLCGPPGCGKTLLAKAVANEAGINFISVKGPELLNMYVGESERAVRQCFQRARSSQPCVIFFDEIDALCPKRTNMENGASRVVNQLLTEMDGMEARPGVFLMAATNRPDIVDPAVMRPGRLDKVLYVGLPKADDRQDILKALTKGGKRPILDEDVDLTIIAQDTRCDGYSGADLAALVREASVQALKEYMATATLNAQDLRVSSRHFTSALEKIRPSVSERDKKRYEDLRLQYAAVPSKIRQVQPVSS